MFAAGEVRDLQRHGLRDAEHRQLAIDRHQFVAIEAQLGRLERHRRILGDVEKILALQVRIQTVAEAPDRGSIDGDIDRPLVSVAIQHHFAADLGKRRALQRKAHVLHLEHRL